LIAVLCKLLDFLVKQSRSQSPAKWDQRFRAGLFEAISNCMQSSDLEQAQQLEIIQNDGTILPAQEDPDFQVQLSLKLSLLIKKSNSVQLSCKLLNLIPRRLLSMQLLRTVLQPTLKITDVVVLLEPFSKCEDLAEELKSEPLFRHILQITKQSRDLPPNDFIFAIDRLLQLHIFTPTSRIIDQAKSFLLGLPSTQEVLSWICKPHSLDPDLGLALENIVKDNLGPKLQEEVGVRPALKLMKKILSSPCNVNLSLEVLQRICAELPPLAKAEDILPQARLWRKFAQVITQVQDHYSVPSKSILRSQFDCLTLLRKEINLVCHSLSTREITVIQLLKLRQQPNFFLRLCKVLILLKIEALPRR